MAWRRNHPVRLTWAAVVAVALGASELALPVVLGTPALRRHGRAVTVAAIAAGLAYLLAKTSAAETGVRALTLLAAVPNVVLLTALPLALAASVRTRRDPLNELRERAERAEGEGLRPQPKWID